MECKAYANIPHFGGIEHLDNNMELTGEPHCHTKDDHISSVKELKRACLDNAETVEKGLREIFDDTCRAFPKEVATKITYKNVVKGMESRKQTKYPSVPNDLEECLGLFQNPAYPKIQQNFQREIRNEEDEIDGFMFGQPYFLDLFRNHPDIYNAKLLCWDGTFYVVPKKPKFYQLFEFGFFEGNKFFPLLLALMIAKTFKAYIAMCRTVKIILPTFDPVQAIADFERASRNAFKAEFTSLERILPCNSHFTRGGFKQVQRKGLAKLYRTDQIFQFWVKKLLALARLPKEMILETFEELMRVSFSHCTQSDQANINKFKLYMRKTWIQSFTIEELSIFGCENSTNNSIESFHALLKRVIQTHRPNLFQFLDKLSHILYDKELDHRRGLEHGFDELNRGRNCDVQANIDRIRALEAQLTSGQKSPMQFLHAISYTFQSQIAALQKQFSQNPGIIYDDPEAIDPFDDANINGDVAVNEPLDLCIICVRPKNGLFAFTPCGHSLACRECSDRIMSNELRETNGAPRCPSCRTFLTGYNQIFISNW